MTDIPLEKTEETTVKLLFILVREAWAVLTSEKSLWAYGGLVGLPFFNSLFLVNTDLGIRCITLLVSSAVLILYPVFAELLLSSYPESVQDVIPFRFHL